MKKTNWTKTILTLVAILTLFLAISKTFVFDPLARIEQDVVETKMKVMKLEIMSNVQQASLNKIEKKVE